MIERATIVLLAVTLAVTLVIAVAALRQTRHLKRTADNVDKVTPGSDED